MPDRLSSVWNSLNGHALSRSTATLKPALPLVIVDGTPRLPLGFDVEVRAELSRPSHPSCGSAASTTLTRPPGSSCFRRPALRCRATLSLP